MIVGHATFCIVVVYNNVVARLRRLSGSFEEASADLGAHTWQTFRYVTFPGMKSALIAGGLLAFALSFDEIIVTNFTIGAGEETLPIWIYSNLFRPHELPIVNAVAVIVILISIIPVYLAHRLGGEERDAGGGGVAGRPRPRRGRRPHCSIAQQARLDPSPLTIASWSDGYRSSRDEPSATYSGMLPCLRFGWSTRLVCSMRRARISFGRVWRGSITSSM